MSEEIRQTPVPVPVVYGQTTTTTTGEMPTQTVEQSSSDAVATTTTEQAQVCIVHPNLNPPNLPSLHDTAHHNARTKLTIPLSTQSPAPAAFATSNSSAPSPAAGGVPARTGTPLRTNGQEANSSRAASQHPDSGFTMPTEAPPHGAPARQYLNSKVTGPLLDGLKMIAKDQ